MRRRIGQRIDDLQLLDDRAGPPVRDDDRQRVRMFRTNVDEMNVQPVDRRDELRQGVQPRLDLAPVVIRLPIARELRASSRVARLATRPSPIPAKATWSRRSADAGPRAPHRTREMERADALVRGRRRFRLRCRRKHARGAGGRGGDNQISPGDRGQCSRHRLPPFAFLPMLTNKSELAWTSIAPWCLRCLRISKVLISLLAARRLNAHAACYPILERNWRWPSA